jgi:Sad1 / UNC-like C-terminal
MDSATTTMMSVPMRAHRLCFAPRESFSFVSVCCVWLVLREIAVGPSYLLVAAQSPAEVNTTNGNDLVRLLSQASIKAQSALQRHEEQLVISKSILKSTNELVSSMAESSDSFQLSEQIAAAERQRDTLIAQANVQQLQELSKELQQRFTAALAAVDNSPSPNVNNGTVSRDDNNDTIDLGQLNARDILNHSENLLTRWIVQHIEQQVDQELQSWDDTTLQSLDYESLATEEASSPLCITPVQAAAEVHAALIRRSDNGDGDGSNGPWHSFAASIVPSLTSSTYVGNGSSDWETSWQWWTRHVPQDWFDGWKSVVPQEWSDQVYAWLQTTVSSVLQPQWEYAWHSLGWAAKTAPPDAILQASNFPGHCWPMAMTGTSTQFKHHQNSQRVPIQGPHVTMRLHPFVSRTAAVTVVVDHVSRMLLWEPETQLQSAPKRFNVYGYGPCPNDQGRRCRGLGFDPTTAVLLTETSLLYDIAADSNIQTFVITPSNATSQSSPAPIPAALDSSHDGSCSAVQLEPSCGAPPPTNGSASPIAAITVEIVENWGNKEYTCLYGLRVHGEPSQ